MSTDPVHDPPGDLDPRGAEFWRRTIDVYELTDGELELLREVCRLLDECESLHAAIDADGVTVLGSTGQTRVHPAVQELRQHRLAVARVLAAIDLPNEDGEATPSPTTTRARKAAQVRWRAHNERRAAGG